MAGTVLTKQGRNLQAKAQAGAPIHYTKVVLGDGELTAGTSLENLTALIQPVVSLGIQDVAVMGDGTSRVRVLVSNDNLNTGFFVREIGVFADDPDDGEILYSIVNRGAQASFLQSKQGDEVIEQILDLITVVGNAQTVTAAIQSSLTLATKKDIEDHDANAYAHTAAFGRHNDDAAAHAAAVGRHNSDHTAHAAAVQRHNDDAAAHAASIAQHNVAGGAHQAAFAQHNDDTQAHAGLLHVWRPNQAYAVGDVVRSAKLPSYAYGECITAGKSAAAEPSWPAVGEEIGDGTAHWRVRDIKCSGMPIGSILTFPAATIPPGYLACNGAAVGRSTYPQLFALLGTSYGAGDGSTTFNLPDLRGEFVRGWDNERGVDSGRRLGSGQEDAIQTITGMIFNIAYQDETTVSSSDPAKVAKGAFSRKITGAFGGNSVYPSQYGYSPDGDEINFDSSRVTRGASETRSRNIAMLYCIKAFDGGVNQGLIDISQIPAEINRKRDRYRGVWVYRGSGGDQSISAGSENAYIKIVFNVVNHDTSEFWDAVNSRIVIPKGINRVTLWAGLVYRGGAVNTSARTISIFKNNDAVCGVNNVMIAGIGNALAMQATCPPINVTEGDYLEFKTINYDTAARLVEANARTFLAMEVVD